MVDNSFRAINLFSDVFRNALVFHIPHSKTTIPENFKNDYVDLNLVEHEIKLLTDFCTDEIFTIPNTSKITFPYSRVFCDVERLDDENEIMFKYGRGYFYTHTDSGKVLRTNVSENKSIVYNDYYLKHHKSLEQIVTQKLNELSFCIIVDCHSFSDTPFKSDIEQENNRPDFCIGTDKFHTPQWLINWISNHLIESGYSVDIDYPYSGTIVPKSHYLREKSVMSVMIEVNRKLYMDSGVVNEKKVKHLNHIFSKLFIF